MLMNVFFLGTPPFPILTSIRAPIVFYYICFIFYYVNLSLSTTRHRSSGGRAKSLIFLFSVSIAMFGITVGLNECQVDGWIAGQVDKLRLDPSDCVCAHVRQVTGEESKRGQSRLRASAQQNGTYLESSC